MSDKFTEEEKKAIDEINKSLKEFQTREDTPEQKATIQPRIILKETLMHQDLMKNG